MAWVVFGQRIGLSMANWRGNREESCERNFIFDWFLIVLLVPESKVIIF